MFRKLAKTANIDAELVFTELLGGGQSVADLLASAQAWAQNQPSPEVIPNVSGTSHALLETDWGTLTAVILPHDDDSLRVEITGPTANWCDYPSNEFVSFIRLDDWSGMSSKMHDLDAFARFVAEQQHKEFLHQIDQERDRIAPSLERWLASKSDLDLRAILESGRSREAAVKDFQAIYPERDRTGLTIEFRRLVIVSIIAPDRLTELIQAEADLPSLTDSDANLQASGVEEVQQLSLLTLMNNPPVGSGVSLNQTTSPAWDRPTLPQPRFETAQSDEEHTLTQASAIQEESFPSSPSHLKTLTIAAAEPRNQENERSAESVHGEQMAQEAVEIAARLYAYGGSIKKIQPDSTQQTWTFTTKNWNISFTLPNTFTVTGRSEQAIRLVVVNGAVSPQSSGITAADLNSFQRNAETLDRKGFSTEKTPAETQLAAQKEWESQTASVVPPRVSVETTGVVQPTLFSEPHTGAARLQLHDNSGGSIDPAWIEMEKQTQADQKTVPASQVAIETIAAINPAAAEQLSPMLQSSDSSPVVEQLQQWRWKAVQIGRLQGHLDKIQEVVKAAKAGTKQPNAEDLNQMKRDYDRWQQVKTLVAQAHRFLDYIQKDEYQKDNYRIQRTGRQLTITDIKEGRGDIVRADGDSFKAKVMKTDIERFADVDARIKKLQGKTLSTAVPELS